MLLTMEVEALNQERYMPSPERLKKVCLLVSSLKLNRFNTSVFKLYSENQ